MKVITVTTVSLDETEVARKNALSDKLKRAVSDYDLEISDANDLLDKANEKAEQARQKLNAVLAEVNAFATEIHDAIGRYADSQGSEWQDTPDGEALDQWRQVWEAIDTTPVKEQDREKFDDAEDGTGDILDDVEMAPRPPRE